MEAWGAIGTIAAIALVFLKQWVSNKPQRDERKADEELQQGRQDIVSGNTDAVTARIDKLLQKNTGDSTTGGKDGKVKGR